MQSLTAPAQSTWTGRIPKVWLAALALSAAVCAAYASVLLSLWHDWMTDPDYSHGILLAPAAAAILYRRRAQVFLATSAPAPSWGLFAVALSQLMLLAGELGGEFFLQRTSLIVLVAGIALYLSGWACLRSITVVLLLTALCVPLPALISHQVTGPLQTLAAHGAEMFLGGLGTPVYRSGNILILPDRALDVAEACSGIRSLISLMALAVTMASFARLHWRASMFFTFSTVFVALIVNVLRIGGGAYIAIHFDPQFGYGFWHLALGSAVFMIAMLLLWTELAVLQWAGARRGASV